MNHNIKYRHNVIIFHHLLKLYWKLFLCNHRDLNAVGGGCMKVVGWTANNPIARVRAIGEQIENNGFRG
jgi:hypothetical protein